VSAGAYVGYARDERDPTAWGFHQDKTIFDLDEPAIVILGIAFVVVGDIGRRDRDPLA
jgi:hypothetical protein